MSFLAGLFLGCILGFITGVYACTENQRKKEEMSNLKP